MPPGPKKLTEEEKTTISQWLHRGAKTARPEPEDPEAVRFTEEELNHWSFRTIPDSSQVLQMLPISNHEDLSVSDAIDLLIREKAKTIAIEPTPQADRRTLIRRLSFNVTGLPRLQRR